MTQVWDDCAALQISQLFIARSLARAVRSRGCDTVSSLWQVIRGDLMPTCATLLGLTLSQDVLCQLDLSALRPHLALSHAHCRFAGKSHPARGRSEPPPMACRGGRRDRLRARPISESSGDHRVSRDPDRLARRRAQVAAVFMVAVFVITSMVRESSDKVTELLLSLPAPRSAYFFRKVCRLRHARLDPRCAQRAPLGTVRKFPGTCPLDRFSRLRAADRDDDESVLRAVLRGRWFPRLPSLRASTCCRVPWQRCRSSPALRCRIRPLTDRVVNAVVELIALLLPRSTA